MTRSALTALILLTGSAALSTVGAQRQGQAPRLQASTRAATALCAASNCVMTDTATMTVLIEYGQPHARGREVVGGLIPHVPQDTIWRLGANTATHLITKIPFTIGSTQLPPGKYSLHMRATATAGDLVVNNATGVWGVPYPGAAQDRARIPMRARNLTDNVESLVIALVPGSPNTNAGVLTITWGKREYSVDWTAQLSAPGRSGGPRNRR